MEFQKVFGNKNLDIDEKVAKMTALLEDGADPNELFRLNTYCIYPPLIASALTDVTGKLLRVFLKFGAHVDATSNYDTTALMKCIDGTIYTRADDNVSLIVSQINIRILVHHGANGNYFDRENNFTAMHITVKPFVIKILLEAGANVMTNKSGFTPLETFLSQLGRHSSVKTIEHSLCVDMMIEAI